MAVLSGALLSGEAIKSRAKPSRTSGEASREIKISLLPPPQSPRGFSALARLFYFAHPTKTAMLLRLDGKYPLVPEEVGVRVASPE